MSITGKNSVVAVEINLVQQTSLVAYHSHSSSLLRNPVFIQD